MSKSKSSALAQKKKRQVQLRDAQRRRRERLRAEKHYFVQILLEESLLRKLTGLIRASGETMQQAVARLLQAALPGDIPGPVENTSVEPASTSPDASAPIFPLETTFSEPVARPEPVAIPDSAKNNQLDLFA